MWYFRTNVMISCCALRMTGVILNGAQDYHSCELLILVTITLACDLSISRLQLQVSQLSTSGRSLYVS